MSQHSDRVGIITITSDRSIPMPESNPHEYDPVLGGQNPPPINAAVLGGLAGVQQRLGIKIPLKNLSKIPLKKLSFETVTVNDRGENIQSESKQSLYYSEDLGAGVTLDMVYVPGGEFMMGSSSETVDADAEKPQHLVNLSHFFMAKYPITQAQYQAIMGDNPAHFPGDLLPVECVSWNDSVEFCQNLAAKTGLDYRLPTEAEWEYSCRAGTTTPFHFGETISPDLANYDGNYTYANAPQGHNLGKTSPIGIFPPNAFGLHDLHGNVFEWCQDTWYPNYHGAPNDGSAWNYYLLNSDRNPPQSRSPWNYPTEVDWNRAQNLGPYVIRGGAWNYMPTSCRSALRFHLPSNYRDYYVGFRVVLTPHIS